MTETPTAFSDLRFRVATALAGTSVEPPGTTVYGDMVDAITPPAYLLQWGDPWLTQKTYCHHDARLDVLCIAGRVEVAPAISTVEELIAVAITRLSAMNLPDLLVLPPGRFDIGGITYIAARLTLVAALSIPAPVYG